MKFKVDWFLWGMLVAVFLSWLAPGPGAPGGWLHPEWLNRLGVAFIFFLHGMALSFASFLAATRRWPVHVVAQGCTFLLFPLLGIVGLALCGSWLPADLRTGFFYLCALPSTVSTSVAMTAAARGNVAAAVFNATLSSLLGVFLTPLWVAWWRQTSGTPLPLGTVVLDLVVWLLLPFAVGHALRPFFAESVKRRIPWINVVDKLTILLLVYTSFCDSWQKHVWSGHGVTTLLLAFTGALLLFALVFALTSTLARALRLPAADRIAAIFCGSKKTLASGVPMAHLIFALPGGVPNPALPLILLPLMIYHPLQLIICGVLAGRWAQRKDAVPEPGLPRAADVPALDDE